MRLYLILLFVLWARVGPACDLRDELLQIIHSEDPYRRGQAMTLLGNEADTIARSPRWRAPLSRREYDSARRELKAVRLEEARRGILPMDQTQALTHRGDPLRHGVTSRGEDAAAFERKKSS